MKIIYIKGKPMKRIKCPSCQEDHLTGDMNRINTVLQWQGMHDSGMTYREIGKEADTSSSTVARLVKMVL